jgi:type IV pilus assembly protein PilN
MPRINLLPWRDEERKERKLKFMVALGGAAIAAFLAAFVGYLLMDSMVSAQQSRNDTLKREIAELDKQIEKINSLEADKARFIARMEVIEKLQRSRPEIVHVFDEIAMRNIDASNYLKNPDLEVVETKKNSVIGATFVLWAQQSGLSEEVDEAKNKPKRRVAQAGGQ